MKQAYSVQEVAGLLGVGVEIAQSLVRLVFGAPRDLLSQHDVVLVREAHALAKTKLPKHRITSTLKTLRTELQGDHPSASVTVGREGRELAARGAALPDGLDLFRDGISQAQSALAFG